jgi:hypothetical protein
MEPWLCPTILLTLSKLGMLRNDASTPALATTLMLVSAAVADWLDFSTAWLPAALAADIRTMLACSPTRPAMALSDSCRPSTSSESD